VWCPRPRPRPLPCCDHSAGHGMCAFGVDIGAMLVVLRRRNCSDSADSCEVSVTLVFVIVSITPLYVASELARLAMNSTVSCWNYVVAAFTMLYPAPNA
jgi:hypothetical protein